MDGQDAAFIQGDEETKFTSELLGLKVHNLLRGLTHKLTVSLEGSVWLQDHKNKLTNQGMVIGLTITTPHFTSPHLISPHLTSPHLILPHLISPILTSPCLTTPLLTPHHFSLQHTTLHYTLLNLLSTSHINFSELTTAHIISLSVLSIVYFLLYTTHHTFPLILPLL